MDTSLTPGFWRLLAVLLVISTAVTFVVTALLDALALHRSENERDPR
ncbi:hypothetical protein [Streptomyces sp. NBC_01614]